MINDSMEAAFPQPDEASRWASTRGMSLRDYFAAKAMQAMTGEGDIGGMVLDIIAVRAYELADAMLKVREL